MVAVMRERGDVGMPATIHALLQARLDTLPDNERLVVGRAAVEGQVFHLDAVAALVPEGTRGDVEELLASLVRKDLVRPERGDAFRFRHLLIRDAAYAALPKELRADLHARFADWLERASESALELDEIIAYHLEQAFRLRAELGFEGDAQRELADAAAQKLLAAGGEADARADLPAAIALLRRGADLLAADDPRRPRTLSALGAAYARRGEFANAQKTLAEAVSAAEAAGDRAADIRARLLLGSISWRTDPNARTEDLLAEALELTAELEPLDDLDTLAHAYATIGTSRFILGRAAQGEADLERAAELAHRAGNFAEEQRALNALLRPKLWGPAPAHELLALCDRILVRDDVNVLLRLHALQVRAVAAALLGDFAASRDAARSAGALIDEYDVVLQRGLYSVDVAFALELSGDLDAAEAELRRGRGFLTALGETGVLATVAGELATVLAQLDRLDEAEALAAESETLAGPDDFDAQSRWRTGLARVRLRRGDAEGAELAARDAVEVVAETDFILLEAGAQHVLGEALVAGARSTEAASAFERAIHLYERKGNLVRLREAQALLEAASTPS
jgi:tetratricopeptide (TPR) repeat protein